MSSFSVQVQRGFDDEVFSKPLAPIKMMPISFAKVSGSKMKSLRAVWIAKMSLIFALQKGGNSESMGRPATADQTQGLHHSDSCEKKGG